MKNFLLLAVNLRLHNNTNLTTDETVGNNLSSQMKTYYSGVLVDYAKGRLVHKQFAQKHTIPKNGGKTIEMRVKKPFGKAITPLTEGVTPNGRKLDWGKLDATVNQYGDYVELSDRLLTEAIDNNLVYATENCGDQSGRTLDTLCRDVLHGGTNVQYADGQVSARHLLVGGDATPANNHYFSVDSVRRAVRFLKAMGANPVNGQDYVAIIHPDVAYDLMGDSKWEAVKSYSDPQGMYNGEIGKLFNTRFVETNEAKIFEAADLTASNRNLTVASVSSKTFTVSEAFAAADATALVGRKVIIKGYQYTVASAAAGAAGAATITVSETVTGSPGASEVIYPGEAGAKGRSVYSTLFLGADAYGDVEISGESLQNIVKPLGSAGTSDPLNQRATSGWKASTVTKRLVEAYMLRVETASTFESDAT